MSDDSFYPSLSEVTSLAMKAVRGAGMSWGIAEEAANSVRWLSAYKLPGPALLAGLLEKSKALDITTLAPDISKQPWCSSGGYVCPLLAAAAFSDSTSCWRNPDYHGVEIIDLAYPLLLLPTIARVSTTLGIWLQVSWDDISVSTDGQSACIQGPFEKLTTIGTHRLRCIKAKDMVTIEQSAQRQSVNRHSWTVLESYAHRTYAPDTEESRRLGAGAD